MSTHRKIEWALFILGLVGAGGSYWLGATMVQTILFGVGALFAGLHVGHLYDGHKSNHVVVATSLLLVGYTGYEALTNWGNVMNEHSVLLGVIVSILLSILSLRLRRDFHPPQPL